MRSFYLHKIKKTDDYLHTVTDSRSIYRLFFSIFTRNYQNDVILYYGYTYVTCNYEKKQFPPFLMFNIIDYKSYLI